MEKTRVIVVILVVVCLIILVDGNLVLARDRLQKDTNSKNLDIYIKFIDIVNSDAPINDININIGSIIDFESLSKFKNEGFSGSTSVTPLNSSINYLEEFINKDLKGKTKNQKYKVTKVSSQPKLHKGSNETRVIYQVYLIPYQDKDDRIAYTLTKLIRTNDMEDGEEYILNSNTGFAKRESKIITNLKDGFKNEADEVNKLLITNLDDFPKENIEVILYEDYVERNSDKKQLKINEDYFINKETGEIYLNLKKIDGKFKRLEIIIYYDFLKSEDLKIDKISYEENILKIIQNNRVDENIANLIIKHINYKDNLEIEGQQENYSPEFAGVKVTYSASKELIDNNWKVVGESEKTIELEPGDNEIIFYYEKDSAIGPVDPEVKEVDYRVRYLEEGSNKTLSDDKVLTGEVGEIITEEAISISGWKLVSPTPQSIKLTKEGANEIIFYYEKDSAIGPVDPEVEEVDYRVRYLEEETEKPIADDKFSNGKLGEIITEKALEFTRWRLISDKEKSIKLTSNNNEIIFYYKRIRTSPSDRKPDKNKEPVKNIEPDIEELYHGSYINGYSDNTVRPQKNITREEAATIVLRILETNFNEKLEDTIPIKLFNDVEMNRWSYETIGLLTKLGILEGYPDGSFKPFKSITRAEIAVIITRLNDLELDYENTLFTDIDSHWAMGQINAIHKKNWVKGYKNEEHLFKPNNLMTRAEFVSLINNMLDRKVKFENLLEERRQYLDLEENRWYYLDFQEAINSHRYYLDGNNDEIWLEIED